MKMYYFSFAKHGHDLDFRRNRLLNLLDEEYHKLPKETNYELCEKMEAEVEAINEIFNYWDGRPASKIPANLYGIAMNATVWAGETRAASCVANGRKDLLKYC